MKNIRETCIQFFQNEDIKRDFKEMMRPVVGIIYNEIYPYIWFICIYHVFIIFIIVTILVLLINYRRSGFPTNNV
jgi:hypothetical protein